MILIGGVIESLHYLKMNRIIHRDIKPDNILIVKKNGKYHCKLADFGGARNFSSVMKTKAIYSAFYAAPELVESKDKPPFSYKSDIYALGVVLFNIIGGGEYEIKAEIPIKTFPKVDSKELKDVLEIAKSLCAINPSERLTIEEVRGKFYCISEEFTKKMFVKCWEENNLKFCYYVYGLLPKLAINLVKQCGGKSDLFQLNVFLGTTSFEYNEKNGVLQINEKLLISLINNLNSNNGLNFKIKIIYFKNNLLLLLWRAINKVRNPTWWGSLNGFKILDFVDKDFKFYSPIREKMILDHGNFKLFRKYYKNKSKIGFYEKVESNDFLSCVKLGMILYYKRKFSKAKESFEKSITIQRELKSKFKFSCSMCNTLGNIYKRLEDYSQAIEYYEKAIKLNPNYVNPYNNIGVIYCILENYPKAVEFYEKSIKINPENPVFYYNLYLVFKNMGDKEKAKINENKYLKLKEFKKKIKIFDKMMDSKINKM